MIVLRSSCSETQANAAYRFKDSLIRKDLSSLYSFVEPSEREALHIDQKVFNALMTEEFFRDWDFSSGQWNYTVSKYPNGTYLLCESLSHPDSRSSLTVSIVGDSGKFRVPAFIHFVLLSCAMRRYGLDKSLPGGLGRMDSYLKLLTVDAKKLQDLGIVAEYDPVSKGTNTFSDLQFRFSRHISDWKAKGK